VFVDQKLIERLLLLFQRLNLTRRLLIIKYLMMTWRFQNISLQHLGMYLSLLLQAALTLHHSHSQVHPSRTTKPNTPHKTTTLLKKALPAATPATRQLAKDDIFGSSVQAFA